MDEATRVLVGQGVFLSLYYLAFATRLWRRLGLPADLVMSIMLGLGALIFTMLASAENIAGLWFVAGSMALVVSVARFFVSSLSEDRLCSLCVGALALAAVGIGVLEWFGGQLDSALGMMLAVAMVIWRQMIDRPTREARYAAVEAGVNPRLAGIGTRGIEERGDLMIVTVVCVGTWNNVLIALLQLNDMLRTGVAAQVGVQLGVVGAYTLALVAVYALVLTESPRLRRLKMTDKF